MRPARLDRPGPRPRPARPAWSTGLVTGLHAPEASHLLLLEAVAGRPIWCGRPTRAAVEHGYLWHEFGDSMLFLPAAQHEPAG